MNIRSKPRFSVLPMFAALVLAGLPIGANALSGAIFTTTDDGGIVNENVRYGSKLEVYLDGGPRMNAPASAAALPDGNYYFQVTDPSGKDLLSRDHISCREIKIENGVITEYPGAGGTNYVKQKGVWQAVSCTEYPTNGNKTMAVHEFNSDIDHGGDPLHAMVIQLYPYDDTPNNGGVYKAWITPVGDYDPINEFDDGGGMGAANQPNQEGYQAGNFHGFIPRFAKTDNFKVKEKKPQFGIIALRNYHDANLNCRLDLGEKFIWQWQYGIEDGLNVRNADNTNDESSGDPTTILLKEALGQLNDIWSLDHFRWTEDQDKNLNSQYFTTSGYVHDYQAFSSLNTGPEDPNLWDGDDANDFIQRFVMEMPCPDLFDDGLAPHTSNEFSDFIPAALGVEPLVSSDPQITITLSQVGFANIKVKKIFDTNNNGIQDGNEVGLANWPVRLKYAPSLLESNGGPVPDTISSTVNSDVYAEVVARFGLTADPILENGYANRMTDANGEMTFGVLLPNGYGDAPLTQYPSDYYQVEEATAQGWMATSSITIEFDVRSEASGPDGRQPPIMGNAYLDNSSDPLGDVVFTNICFNEASFGTKGYWHNKNGLGEMETAFVTSYINTLDPYDSETSYFGKGDEPFDGMFTNGTLVDPAYKNDKVTDGISAGAGTVKAEVSHFLIDSNGGGDPREQLAQQLLAFLFNIEYRLGGDAVLMMPGGGTMSTADIVSAAIAAWQGTDAAAQNHYKTLLDTFNNMKVADGNGVKYVPSNPSQCPALPVAY
ncbi:hypothetical protein [Shewanella pealeana]|uniref:Uncharacterized protein n=1 Tax=Shewanella pealeana (strain ATCC 700345 / ANG-SQ1) TaxID=398579 RepID=A8H3G3_SHEPA|nr:hypothetical protein [Shewanella pealeana]ABV87100.1 conserved hypothetical protein [Shewanella pealeana ATCC 700345]